MEEPIKRMAALEEKIQHLEAMLRSQARKK